MPDSKCRYPSCNVKIPELSLLGYCSPHVTTDAAMEEAKQLPERLVKTLDIADAFGVTQGAVQNWVKTPNGFIEGQKLGKNWYVRTQDIPDIIIYRRTGSRPEGVVSSGSEREGKDKCHSGAAQSVPRSRGRRRLFSSTHLDDSSEIFDSLSEIQYNSVLLDSGQQGLGYYFGVDGSLLSYVIEELVCVAVIDIAIPADSSAAEFIDLLPFSLKQRVRIIDEDSNAAQQAAAILAPIVEEFGVIDIKGNGAGLSIEISGKHPAIQLFEENFFYFILCSYFFGSSSRVWNMNCKLMPMCRILDVQSTTFVKSVGVLLQGLTWPSFRVSLQPMNRRRLTLWSYAPMRQTGSWQFSNSSYKTKRIDRCQLIPTILGFPDGKDKRRGCLVA